MSVLSVQGLHAGYGRAEVLHGLDLQVEDGEVVVVLGANGAGKTTLMRALAGTIARRGSVRFGDRAIEALPAHQIARQGVRLVPQGRGTMTNLSVRDNLFAGAIGRRDGAGVRADIDAWCQTFPNLGLYIDKRAGNLSGGEQQMLALARALIGQPRLLLCDEPSLGLAPIVVQQLFGFLREVNADRGTAMLIVEQNADRALALAQRAYLLEVGHIVGSGDAASMRNSDAVRRAYLGI